jgi:hypothetical protein
MKNISTNLVKFQFTILSFDCLNLIFDFGFMSIDILHSINVWFKTVVGSVKSDN